MTHISASLLRRTARLSCRRFYSTSGAKQTPEERRAQFLHTYTKENSENYLGNTLVSSAETEGMMRGAIVYGFIKKFLVPEEFLYHPIITSRDGVSTLYKIHKAFSTLHHVSWKWSMDMMNRYELPDEVRMACFMADNYQFPPEEKELLQAYANELYEHYNLALDCEHISSIVCDMTDRFRNTYDEVTQKDIDLINSLLEKYNKLLARVKDDPALTNKIEGDVGVDLVFLVSYVDIPDVRNKFPTIFRYM